MQKAFEYEVEFDSRGRVHKKRLSVGPILVTSVIAPVLALTGHALWTEIAAVLKMLKE